MSGSGLDSKQAHPPGSRLGVAMGTHGKNVCLAARQRADKVATVLRSVVRKHPIVNSLDDPMNNSGFGVGKFFFVFVSKWNVRDVRLNLGILSAAPRHEDLALESIHFK